MRLNEDDLRNAHARLSSTYQGLWQDYFALLYLSREFGLTDADAAAQTAFGGHDYGIDAFHIAADRRNLYLYQFKWTEDHKQFAAPLKRLAEAGFERIFGNTTQDPAQNAVLTELKYALHEKKALVDQVFMQCVFRGDLEAAENSKHLEALREELESRRFHLDQFFGRPVELVVEFVSVEHGRRGARVHSSTTHEFPVTIEAPSEAPVPPGGHRMVLGFIPLHELHGFHLAMDHRLFDRNIRFGLSAENSPNREIRRCLEAIVFKGTEPPEHFGFYHNGISIAAQALRRDGDSFRIVEPRILNGAQTVTTVSAFLKRNEANPHLQQHRERFRAIKVLAKIIVASDPAFITTVTINNNRQNPVEAWNLRANDDTQLRLHDAFAEQLKLYYERQQGAFRALSNDDLEEHGLEGTKAVELRRLAKALLAIQGEVKRMSTLGDVFEQDAAYAKTFRSDYIEGDLRELVVAYKVGLRVRQMVIAIQEKGQNKYWYVDRAKNLLWALGIQALFNEYKREDLLSYGADLRVPAGFAEMLREVSSSRIRPLISQTVDSEHVAEVEAGKLSFLQSNATYQACMQDARRRWRWAPYAPSGAFE